MLTALTTPTTTPPPSLASAYGAILAPRQTTDLYGGYSYNYGDCYNYAGGAQCLSIIGSCSGDAYATNYAAAATSCMCTYGISYLDCYISQVATGTCSSYLLGTADWHDFETSYYEEYCGSIPPSVMGKIGAPTKVVLSFETVDIVTAKTPLGTPTSVAAPLYTGTGPLLEGACSKPDFTLVDAGSTVYYAGFLGCNGQRPECCPWQVATPAANAGAAPTNTNTAGAAEGTKGGNLNFPQPANGVQATLVNCAADYYSISGGCCPTGFWPFTSVVAGQTPCWSSSTIAALPTLTVGSDNNKTAETSKPTSAVVNIVWSMRYPVADAGSSKLSTAAMAGIGAGSGVAAILIAGLGFCLWRSRRKTRKLESEKTAQIGQAPPPPQQPDQQPDMMQQAPPPNGQYPPGPPMQPPSDQASYINGMSVSSPSSLFPQHTGASGGGVSQMSSQTGHGLLQGGQPGGYFNGAGNPRVSYPSSGGTASPATTANGQGFPVPIAEGDEGQGQPQGQPQYFYPPQQQQQQQQPSGYPPQQFPPPGQLQQFPPPGQQQFAPQGQFYAPPQQPMVYDQQAGGFAPPAPQQQQPPQGYPSPVPQHQQAYPQQPYQQQASPPQGQQQMYQPQAQSPQYGNAAEVSANREIDPPQEVMGSRVPL
ncbi:hypothetical protein B0T22DRAFT_112792 [Podospora appendiculata]|uniref:Uncharacterized protein n=1 Tax=Podospora appendiculata TaxID=314037 RepID=A0AAE0XLC3_9PEZI|nr:hypothetical protein B0T22DRAFT_112792 [Podospora appendiculata]